MGEPSTGSGAASAHTGAPPLRASGGAILLDGKALAAKVRAGVALRAARFTARAGRPPGLAVVRVGEDPASAVYVRNKLKASQEAGIASFAHDLPASASEAQLLTLVSELNRDARVDGILVQLPLPAGVDANRIMDAVDPAKDVDGFHPANTGLLAQKRPRLRPCTALRGDSPRAGVRHCTARHAGNRRRCLQYRRAADGAGVDDGRRHRHRGHTGTRDLKSEVERAELVVAAVGKAGFIPGDWIRPGPRCLTWGSIARHPSAGRRRRFRARGAAGRLDHPGPRGHRPDDHRHVALQHSGRRGSEAATSGAAVPQ